MLGLALAQTFWQAAAALAALAVGTSFNYALANTTVQERAPGPLRGRVSALAMMSFVGVMPFSSLAGDGAGRPARHPRWRWSSARWVTGWSRSSSLPGRRRMRGAAAGAAAAVPVEA